MMKPFERLFQLIINPWFAACYLIVVVVSFYFLDARLALFFHHKTPQAALGVLNWLTDIGLGGFYLLSLLVLTLFFQFIYHKPKWAARCFFLWLCVFIPSMICIVIKILAGRARPELLFTDHIYAFHGLKTTAVYWSFPSGHTTNIVGFVCGLSLLFPRYTYAYFALAFLVAGSRIILTNHYLSDVMVATYLAILEVGLLAHFIKEMNWMKRASHSGCFKSVRHFLHEIQLVIK